MGDSPSCFERTGRFCPACLAASPVVNAGLYRAAVALLRRPVGEMDQMDQAGRERALAVYLAAKPPCGT